MTTTAGRAFDIVRAAIESSGAPIRMRGDHTLMTSCPLHADTHPSLSVTWTSRGHTGGAVLLHCFSCGAHAATIAAAFGLRLSDLFDESAPRQAGHIRPTPSPHRAAGPPQSAAEPDHHWQRVRVYTYTTAAGTPVQQVIREECRSHGAPHKRFLQRYRDGRHWVWRKPAGFTPVLYRAPELAAAGDRWVWLTEGEKDADTAAALGRLATTNAQGALSFPPALAAQLANRKLAIVIDRDPAGYQRARTLHELLRHQARRCVLLLPATTAPKSDLTDHLDAGLWQPTHVFGGLIAVSRDELAAGP